MLTFVQAGASCKWVDDSQHLILEHFDTICNSPSQIYHSALPLCPSSSWLHKYHAAELSQEVKVVKGVPAGWGTCSRTVTLDHEPRAVTCWKDTVAVGLNSGKIITLDEITGIQTAILSGHAKTVRSLAFLPDGTSLVSGSEDNTIRLWDVQTGGVVKTLHLTDSVLSVSISADCTSIASASWNKTIQLWDIQTGECCCVIGQQEPIDHVRFSPTNPQYLISVSGDKVWHWDINGHQTNPTHIGSHIAFSLDGTQFVSCYGGDIMVQNSSSGGIVAKFHAADSKIDECCFSPDGRLISTAAGKTAHVWDTTSSCPHPIKTFVGHTARITSLAFSSPSSLISSALDKSVKFWEIGTIQADPVAADPESTPLTLPPIVSITLQAKDGIVISSDSDGVVKTWDISTGLCKASYQTIAKGPKQGDAQLISNRLIFVWCMCKKIHIWDVEKGEPLQIVDINFNDDEDEVEDLKISGDNVVCLWWRSIQAWSIQTGEVVVKVKLGFSEPQRSLTVDGSRVWVCSPESEPLGWDFGTLGSSPVQLSNSLLLLAKNAKLWDAIQSRIKDVVTGGVVFQLAGRFVNPADSQWDGHYLVAGYLSGEVLILDFNHVYF